jgi:nitrous oxidase accessory protein NosD
MSYTLRGRLDSRLLAGLAPAVAAAVLALALHKWWPVEIAGAMVAAGVVLDVLLYDRLLDYQPAWAAVPLGAVELAAVMGLARVTGIMAPLGPAVAFFAGSWLLAQVLGHAVYPWTRLSYADDGGELGRTGASAGAAVAALFLAAGGVAYATKPPTVTLSAGVHQGPLVITREEQLVGKPGAIVRGGIVIRASGVEVRNVTVLGGVNGIDVEGARRVMLDGVRVIGSSEDGIHARFSQVMVRNCAITLAGPYAQGIDISYAMTIGMSSVEGCDVSGGSEGIVTHDVMATVSRNHVHGTKLRGITMTEMSMGKVTQNEVTGATGVGVYCGDHSECEIERNVVAGTRGDGTENEAQAGIGIEADYYADATLDGNAVGENPVAVRAFDNSLVSRR